MNEPILEVKNLTKDFNGFRAVDDVSFEIGKGEIVGLLGPNGAGKTTTITMLLGITKPTAGQIKVFSFDLEHNRRKISQRINFTFAHNFFSDRLTLYENLLVFAYLYEIKNAKEKINKLLSEFDLFNLRGKLTQVLSSGQVTRLSLCKALLNDPELLFLDEPTASLDPEIAQKTRDLLLEIKRERNISIVYTSHNMEEVTQMCDRVIFLSRGRIVASGDPLMLTKMIKDCFLTLTFDAPLVKVKKFGEEKGLNFQIPQPNILEITLKEEEIGDILTQLARNGIEIVDIEIKKPDLEDVFLKIAKEQI